VSRAAGETEDETPVEHVVAVLRERLYGAISCLAALAVLARYTTEDTSPWARMLDVAIAAGGLWAASLFSDWVAHLSVHSAAPRGRELLRMLQSSGQILQAAALPVAVLAVAGFADLNTYTATWVAMWILVAELGLITLLAVRRTELPWWQKAFAVAVLAGIGAIVLVIKMLAH
jgi:hypothetical protein